MSSGAVQHDHQQDLPSVLVHCRCCESTAASRTLREHFADRRRCSCGVSSRLFLVLFTISVAWLLLGMSASSPPELCRPLLTSLRFFLGFVEAAFLPGALLILSKWYTRRELTLRNAILFAGNLISNAFSALVGAGV